MRGVNLTLQIRYVDGIRKEISRHCDNGRGIGKCKLVVVCKASQRQVLWHCALFASVADISGKFCVAATHLCGPVYINFGSHVLSKSLYTEEAFALYLIAFRVAYNYK